MLSHADNMPYSDLPDSTRSSIRLKSYLLIEPQEFSAQEIDSLLSRNIPLAIFVENVNNPGVERWFQKLSEQQNFIPVVLKNAKATRFPENPALIIIEDDLFDKVNFGNLQPDSLFNDTLFSLNELLLAVPDMNMKNSADIFFKLWSQSGKLPNFIQSEKMNLSELAEIVDSLNATEKIFGVVRNRQQLLEHVSWKDFANRKTNGYFCFPLVPGFPRSFVPYKPGFRFSPDIILDSPSNKSYLKEFKAIALDAGFGLVDHFVFSRRVLNLQRNNKEEIINNGVEFIDDDERQNCAWFPGRAYVDAGIRSISTLKPNFSVTAWIKPTRIDANNSILGKGKDFVLKLHDGFLTYTMQGIKDYHSRVAEVPVNQWTFISLVHSAYENKIRYYLNGELVDEKVLILPYSASDHTLLIGSNLWEEFFVGYMDDIKIWERELNDHEVRQEFLRSVDEDGKSAYQLLVWIVVPVLLLLGFYLYFRKRKHKVLPQKTNTKRKAEIKLHYPGEGEKLLCFGGLKVIDQHGTDVSQKFSPKVKQLFVLILLNSVDGQKGITTKKLSGILWPGMSPQAAKNTRGTNMQNLKAALASCDGIKLVFQDKLWSLELDESCYCDYADALTWMELLEKTTDKQMLEKELPALLVILKNGIIFPNMSNSWLDPYVSKMSDRIVELGLKLFDELDEEKHAALHYELAEVVSMNDPLNEPALRKKLQILTRQGKLSLAHTIYDHFTKLYKELYQEAYPVGFRNLTQEV